MLKKSSLNNDTHTLLPQPFSGTGLALKNDELTSTLIQSSLREPQFEVSRTDSKKLALPLSNNSKKVKTLLRETAQVFTANDRNASQFEINVRLIIQWLDSNEKLKFGKTQQALFLYDDYSGCFQPLDADGFAKFLLNSLPSNLQMLALDKKVVEALKKYIMSLKGRATNLTTTTSHNFVNLKNGVLDLRTLTLNPKSPRYGFQLEVNAKWVPNSEISITTKKFLSQLAYSEFDETALLQVAGYSLSNVRNLQLSPYIQGLPRNGKSTFLKFLQRLLPPSKVVAFSIEDFSDKFAAACLQGKHVSICADLELEALKKRQQAVFKKLVGGDAISARKIYGDYSTFENTCLMLFASNGKPKNIDPRDGVARRIWLIKTGLPIAQSEIDVNLGDKLFDDRDAFATLALREFAEVYTGNCAPNKNDLTFETVDFTHKIDFLPFWVDHFLVETPESFIRNSDLYTAFCSHYQIHGTDEVSPELFYKHLHKEFPHFKYVKRQNANGILGFKLKEADVLENSNSETLWGDWD